MPAISPEEMAMMQKDAGKDSSGQATKLVQRVASDLAQLGEMLAQSKGVTDQDIEQMNQINQMFTDLVEKKLAGSSPGEDVQEESPEMSQIPMDAGRTGKPMGPATKN